LIEVSDIWWAATLTGAANGPLLPSSLLHAPAPSAVRSIAAIVAIVDRWNFIGASHLCWNGPTGPIPVRERV
jgi:hypothetical protein